MIPNSPDKDLNQCNHVSTAASLHGTVVWGTCFACLHLHPNLHLHLNLHHLHLNLYLHLLPRLSSTSTSTFISASDFCIHRWPCSYLQNRLRHRTSRAGRTPERRHGLGRRTCAHTHTHTHTDMYLCTCARIILNIVDMYMYTCLPRAFSIMCIYMQGCMYIHAHTYMHICICIYIHTCNNDSNSQHVYNDNNIDAAAVLFWTQSSKIRRAYTQRL